MAEKIGVVNQGEVHHQTNNVTIHEGQKRTLLYSDPLPDRSHFQGRVSQQKDLHEWLKQDSNISLIGVKGEGGIGKSTLTAKVFADCAGFGGKCWVDVRSGTSLSGVARSALQEFGVPTEQVNQIEEKDLPRRLLRQMQMQRCLLAIDNLESVLGGDGVWQGGYEEFLDGFEELGGESVILLAGREYPQKYRGWRKSRWLAVETGLEPGEGAALLGALEAEGTEAERSTLSVRVEGNPLALALLAGWLREEYRVGERSVTHLAEHSDLFQVEGKHRGDRLSLAGVFAWSFDRLSATAQELLTQVSVLRGGFNREAAGALVQREVADRELQDLERRSLLQELPGRDRRGQLGYRLQPRVQDFAHKRNGDLTQAHERAIQHFWSHRQTEFATTDTEEAAHEYLETYYHQCQLGRYQSAFQTVYACDEFLRRHGYWGTLVDLYEFLRAKPLGSGNRSTYAAICNNLGIVYRSLGQYEQAFNLHQQHYAIALEMRDRKHEAISLSSLGTIYQLLGKCEQAIKFHRQHHDIARAIGDRRMEALSLCNLGTAYQSLGQYEQAINFHQQHYEIARDIGDREGEASSLGNLGSAYRFLGRYEQAINFHQQHYEIARDIGDKGGEASSLGSLGAAYNSLRQYQQAINLSRRYYDIVREIGDRGGEAISLHNLGNAHYFLGQYEQAIKFHQQSLDIHRETGNRGGEAASLGGLGNIYNDLGEYKQALELYEQSLAIHQETGNRGGEAASLSNLGTVYSYLGEYKQALELYEQSLVIKKEIGDQQGEANSLGNLGIAYASLGQYDRAIDLQQQSLVIKRKIGDRGGEALSLGNWGAAYASLGQYDRAIDLYQQSLVIEREIGDKNGEAHSLFNQATSLRKLYQHSDALQCFQQALAIYTDLKLDHKIEQCKVAISQCSQIIADQQQHAPTIKDKPRFPLWLWFALGLAGALLVWWLKR